jgi:hypothetical protein
MTDKQFNSLDDLIDLKDAYEKKVSECGKELLKKEFRNFFEATPEVESVRWTQYTPSFNDGDPCVFQMGELQYKSAEREVTEENEDEDDGDEDGEGFRGCYWYNGKSDVSKDTQKKLEKLENLINRTQDVMELVFGDGVEITASQDGFETEEYWE